MGEKVLEDLIIDPKIAELAAHASKEDTEEAMRLDRLGDLQGDVEDESEDEDSKSEYAETPADYYAAATEARKSAQVAIAEVVDDPRTKAEVEADGDSWDEGEIIPGV